MNLGIKGRVAMVLGAAGGLGSATAKALMAEGARLAACDLDPAGIPDELAESCLAVPLDLRHPEAPSRAVDHVEHELGPVEILVNITGGPPPSAASGVPLGDWQHHFQSMVVSIFALTDRVLPNMRASGWGRIVTSTSSGVLAPIPMLGVSNTLRSALHGWSKTLASEVAADGVTVNTIVPGRIGTTRIAELDRKKAERSGKSVGDVERESLATIPVGRYGAPQEYGQTIAFLCGEPASYITGSVIRVDGGMIPSV